MSKYENALETHVADSDVSMSEFNGTVEDARDMDRLGRAQQLKVRCLFYEHVRSSCHGLCLHLGQRNFRSVSILGLTCVIMCTWMGILSYVFSAFIIGGYHISNNTCTETVTGPAHSLSSTVVEL